MALSHQAVKLPFCTFSCGHPHAAPAHGILSCCVHTVVCMLGQVMGAAVTRESCNTPLLFCRRAQYLARLSVGVCASPCVA